MARVTVVKAARKPQGKCEKCGTELKETQPYKWVKTRAHRAASGRTRKRCTSCPNWKPSELTSSSARSSVYAAQEDAYDRLSAWDRESVEELRSILEDCAEGIREGAEAYRESAQNMEDGFGHATSLSDELNEKADTLDSSADEVEQANVEDFDEDAALEEALTDAELWQIVNVDGSGQAVEAFFDTREEAEEIVAGLVTLGDKLADFRIERTDGRGMDPDLLPDSVREAVDEKREEWAEEQEDNVRDAIDNVEIP